ncbi:MAG: type I-U CRISPR-associated helicase/endonuclease Cas3 [Deltaproteobacteria bacterium]|nr:type I-U CRISPR-associated helicase/endonuclease Cas3 [Deltaproteobacteria bacterium]
MSFVEIFRCITGCSPFPWQVRLYEKFAVGEFPSSANIPTGLGKTSVVVIWAIALALNPDKVPRRLVYVVNRRTVVDQTTTEVENMRTALAVKAELKEIETKLRDLCALPLPRPTDSPLAISTLRGQFGDNREWSADPTRPAVIIGTVDMIGSGLLFSRYTVGYKLRPHHAAFLAQDAFLVHDEAHLEPAFQQLLESVVAEQNRCNDPRKLKVMELSATTRTKAAIEVFSISDADSDNNFVKNRLNAVKRLSLIALGEKEKEQDKIIELTLARKDSGRAILVFVRSVADATKIASELEKKLGKDKKDMVRSLTGTMRGKERDELVKEPVFRRFLQKNAKELSGEGTVFLVATSAGEVGVNISADDLICDLSTYESMAQRFGRVNRFGERDDSAITVVCPTEFPHTKKIQEAEKAVAEKKKDAEKKLQTAIEKAAYDIARESTMALLMRLDGSASPASLDSLPDHDRIAAFSPPPKMRQATNIQFDAWALTSIRKPIAARPPVAPYLHGEAEWQPPETHIAWREELELIHGDLLGAYPPEDLLEDFPLKPHELLRDTSKRIAETLSARIEKYLQERADDNAKLKQAWLIGENGSVSLFELASPELQAIYAKSMERTHWEKEEIKRHKDYLRIAIENVTLILPASLGGISELGLFTADLREGKCATDVAAIKNVRLRVRAGTPDIPAEYVAGYRLVRVIDTAYSNNEEHESTDRYWLWLEEKKAINGEKRSTVQPETLKTHAGAVVANIISLAHKLFPAISTASEPNLRRCLPVAAQMHDEGKNRLRWQQGIGNTRYNPNDPNTIYAKSGGLMRSRNLAENYRHEFGSLNTITTNSVNPQIPGSLSDLTDLEHDIILHLIAAHHGRARPHFPENEIFDYHVASSDLVELAAEVPRRFARLQQHFGRWGLTWLESILRAADYAASAGIVADQAADTACPQPTAQQRKMIVRPADSKTIRLRVDVTNPGQYFACCGLFELAAQLTPNVKGHFEQDESMQWWFILSETDYSLSTLLEKITEAEIIPASGIAGKQEENLEEEDEETEDDTSEEGDEDKNSLPLFLGNPFGLRLDWWETSKGNSTSLKVWAGSMNVLRIASAMKNSMTCGTASDNSIDNFLHNTFVVYKQDKKKIEDAEERMKKKFMDAKEKENESINKAREVMDVALEKAQLVATERSRISAQNKAEEKFELTQQKAREVREKKEEKASEDFEQTRVNAKKKVEPFYFDAKRGPNADARDVGFSPNTLKFETDAAPAVEILCLIGLQRAIPSSAKHARQFIYYLWTKPLSIELLVAALTGQLPDSSAHSYRFESWFRTSQKKHKAFLAAQPIVRS